MIAPHYADDAVTLHHGDVLAVLRADDLGYDYELGYGTRRAFPDASVDAVVTDPPYGIAFMGKAWDQPGEFGSTSRKGGGPNLTVKPLDLMRWLVRLVTPPGGVVLEPFAGSGTTAEACVVEGFRCIAIEREADYLPLITSRLTKPIPLALDLEVTA